MYYAVMADIHSNLEALTRVLREIGAKKPDKIVSPGDIVGYGADPNECLNLVVENCDLVVMGNHDQAIQDVELRTSFNEMARAAIEWTADCLPEESKEKIRTWPRLSVDQAADLTVVHASPNEPGKYHYLFDSHDAETSFALFSTRGCFIGHTHVPSLFSSSGSSGYLSAGKHQLSREQRYIINPGSVGQPRDRNPQASVAFYDSEKLELEIVRLDYDNQTAAQKIRNAGLPSFLADRLL